MVEIEEEFTFDERVRRGGRAESESERVLSQSNKRNCFEVKSVSSSKNWNHISSVIQKCGPENERM